MNFGHVKQGDIFEPSAEFHNATADLINGGKLYSLTRKGAFNSNPVSMICIASEEIKSDSLCVIDGIKVALDNQKFATIRNAKKDDKNFVFVKNQVKANDFVKIFMDYVTLLEVTSIAEDHFVKVDDKQVITACRETTNAEIITRQETFAIVRINNSANPPIYEYNGYFAVKKRVDETATKYQIDINSGYLNCNGELKKIPQSSFIARTGILCLCRNLNNGVWDSPYIEYKDELDTESIPIAETKIDENENLEIRQILHGIAYIIKTGKCPIDVNNKSK